MLFAIHTSRKASVMAEQEPDTELPEQFLLCERMMASWFETCLAATDQWFKLWMFPFAPPPADQVEQEGDLDVPGPLERDHEHNLFA